MVEATVAVTSQKYKKVPETTNTVQDIGPLQMEIPMVKATVKLTATVKLMATVMIMPKTMVMVKAAAVEKAVAQAINQLEKTNPYGRVCSSKLCQ